MGFEEIRNALIALAILIALVLGVFWWLVSTGKSEFSEQEKNGEPKKHSRPRRGK